MNALLKGDGGEVPIKFFLCLLFFFSLTASGGGMSLSENFD